MVRGAISLTEQQSVDERCIRLGEYLVEHQATVRSTAKAFGISKSTTHKDLRERLPKNNKGLYQEVQEILQQNKQERHIRGGNATKEKYLLLNKHK